MCVVTIDLVIPVYNEEKDIENSVRKLLNWIKKQNIHTYKIVIVNNNSTDNTLKIVKKLELEFSYAVKIINIPQKGRGIALRSAWMISNADICAFMDADLSTDLRFIPEIIEPIVKNEVDICCGSRWHNDSDVKRDFIRGILSWFYNFILRTSLGVKISDAQCGFKSINTSIAKKILPFVEDNNWFFDSELLSIAQKNNIRIKEIPIIWIDNVQTTVTVSKTIMEFLKGIKRMKKNGIPQI